MRILKVVGALVAGLFVVLIVGTGVAWAVAGAPEKGHVAPNVELAGIDVSSMSADQLDPVLSKLTSGYAAATITIGPADESFRTSSTAIGLTLDRSETSRRVMDVGRKGNIVSQLTSWMGSLRDRRQSDVAISWNNDSLQSVVASQDPGPRTEATEPSLSFVDNEMKFEDGKDGEGISAKDVADKLPDAAKNGLPINVVVGRGSLEPRFSTDELKDAFAKYKASYVPIQLVSGRKTVPLTFDQLQPWLRAVVKNGALSFSIDEAAAAKDLPGVVPNAGIPVIEAHWEVVGSVPSFSLGTPGSTCCDPQAGTNLRNALFPVVGSSSTQVDLGLTVLSPKVPAVDPASLGIKEKVSTFSTSYPAGQPRVKNIHRISDLVRGAVINPGETFSLNGYVGPRTIEKGFVADHAIEDGVFVESVGGGISQFSTTLFNAAFFAGLDWDEYQAHTIYISRYPYGREATISFPKPDQKIKNTTPYGILIWPQYSGTSLTVDFYSTKFVDAQQTGQNEQKVGACTKVNTERTRRYLDGKTVVDSVSALYQPAEGVRC